MSMLMSKAEALIYVFGILEERYFLTYNDQVGQLCSELNPVEREGTDILVLGDPVAWSDWDEAVKKVTNKDMISGIQAKQAMIELMKKLSKEGFQVEEAIDHFQYVLIPQAWGKFYR